tara:strand:- start:2286 stop:4214 length:1929 start_codon:yes stop_codon:yes gene_type:complete
MLDKNALTQLKQLKQEIHDSTPRFDGTVRGSNGRYGFATTDDGKSYFLPPDEMEKVLPGDSISFRVEAAGDGKEQAIVEKLISSGLDTFCGRYIVRGKGHFIEPDHDTLNRWIFVPPNDRAGAADGDFVSARMRKHPYPHGKAQAAITGIIGNLQTRGIERLFMQARFGLEDAFSDEVKAAVAEICSQPAEAVNEGRYDLTHLPFVTIDSAGTRDIDDALCAESHSDGWTLWVAIADPEAVIPPGSVLDDLARRRATSVYFADGVLPMLPPELSEQASSLQAQTVRPAMVAELHLAQDAAVKDIKLYEAIIESRAKLTYSQVAQHIAGVCEDIPADLHGSLHHLADCASALNQWRRQHCLLMEERPDFRLILDDEGQISDIVRIDRNDAHKLVEECMLVCNRSVAEWLKARNAGFFIEQSGIRTERLGEATALLKEQLTLDSKPDLSDLPTYVSLQQQAAAASCELPLRTILSRQMQRSEFGRSGQPHMGLGFTCYTTFTSPLRKYNDLLIHRTVKALLNETTPPEFSDELLQGIQQSQNQARVAASLAEQWLKLNWLSRQPEGQAYEGTLVNMNSSSFTVRMNDTGIEGVIDRRKAKGKWVFDSKTMTHRQGDDCFMLGQPIKVIVQEIDAVRRQLKLRLA